MAYLKIKTNLATQHLTDILSEGLEIKASITDIKESDIFSNIIYSHEVWKEKAGRLLKQIFDDYEIGNNFIDYKSYKIPATTHKQKLDNFKAELDGDIKTIQALLKEINEGVYRENIKHEIKHEKQGTGRTIWDVIVENKRTVYTLIGITALILIFLFVTDNLNTNDVRSIAGLPTKDNKEKTEKNTDDTNGVVLNVTDEAFERDFNMYLKSVLNNNPNVWIVKNEKYSIQDVIVTDTVLYILVVRTKDTGRIWADGRHSMKTAFIYRINKDSTIKSIITGKDLYIEHGCIGLYKNYVMSFLNFKTDADSKDYLWKGYIYYTTNDLKRNGADTVFTSINAGFFPYLTNTTVTSFSYSGYFIYENSKLSKGAINDIKDGDKRFKEHLRNYETTVLHHSDGWIKNNIDDKNGNEDLFKHIRDWLNE